MDLAFGALGFGALTFVIAGLLTGRSKYLWVVTIGLLFMIYDDTPSMSKHWFDSHVLGLEPLTYRLDLLRSSTTFSFFTYFPNLFHFLVIISTDVFGALSKLFLQFSRLLLDSDKNISHNSVQIACFMAHLL